MKALVIHGAKDLRLETRDAEAPGPGQVAVALKAGGICGSDLHYYNHGGFGPIKLREPMVLGHEVAGEIVELGPDVEGLRVGQLVAISPSRPCYNCLYCREWAVESLFEYAILRQCDAVSAYSGGFSGISGGRGGAMRCGGWINGG